MVLRTTGGQQGGAELGKVLQNEEPELESSTISLLESKYIVDIKIFIPFDLIIPFPRI